MSNRRLEDLTGNKYGRLTVIGLAPKETRKTYWMCQCDCGNFKKVRADSLKNGAIRSCGCLKKEMDEVNLTKGYARQTRNARGYVSGHTRLYGIWQKMRKRCQDPSDLRFERYGGRGIKVCDEWNDFGTFHDWAVNNGYADDLTIDRIDNDGDYEPSNCRWATSKEQSNNRSTNVNITIGNTTKTLTEWCEIFNLNSGMVFARYNRNDDLTLDELFRS